MSFEANIHPAQTSILRELLFKPVAGYAELQKPTGLSSDHFNFHIKRLLEVGLIEKSGPGHYKLSVRGKEYANKLDTDQNVIERQPKVAVLLAITRLSAGREQFLFQERRKHPYFGYWGFPSGKARWGESIIEAAERELREETGLSADIKFLGIYHERAYQTETEELLEDKIFFVVRCSNIQGELIEEIEGGINHWLDPQELPSKKTYTSLPTELALARGQLTFSEEVHHYPKQEF